MTNKKFVLGIFSAAIMGGLIAAVVVNFINQGEQNVYQNVQDSPTVQFSNYQGVNANQASFDFTQAAAATTPAVVHIKTYVKVSSSQYELRTHPLDDLFRDFFGDPYGNQYQSPPPSSKGGSTPQERRAGSGSGVILTMDGYIVTNNHVIKGADKIEVVLNDKRSYEAKLVGIDPTTDLAVLKIEGADNLTFVNFGDSDALQIGEWVLAVGNPFDLTSTVTAGIVSAKARNINILKENLAIESFIQTDAAVNPGNSGGALVNLKGELVGINSAIATPTGSFAGYSFAVPATIAKKVVADLKEFGEVQRALLGVSIKDMTSELVEEKKLGKIQGVYIAGTREDGSAADAGLLEGDIITAINDVKVNTASELQEQVARYRPGNKVVLSYIRNGKSNKTEVTLKNRLGNTEIVTKESIATTQILGAILVAATDDELRNFNIPNGVKVESLGSGKFKSAGVQKDFMIVAIDKKRVSSPEDVANILNNKNGGVLIEGIYPNGRRAYYAIGW